MMGVLCADTVRMMTGKRLWIMTAAMLGIAGGMVCMQYTAMDYTVPLSRVVFLPMSFYGVVTAALVSMFVGENYSDGIMRNKLIAGCSRAGVYVSLQVVVWGAALTVYMVTAVLTACVGLPLFPRDVSAAELLWHLLLGMFTCLAYGSVFCLLSVCIDNKATAVMVCMGAAFAMLVLSLHTNQMVIQEPMKNGAVNPHYVGGTLRSIYLLLHDLNPTGQAAQLSAMKCLSPVRWVLTDVVWMVLGMIAGAAVLEWKDIK